MAKGEVVGSLVAAGGFRLCTAFSTATLRRKLLEAVICGGGGVSRHVAEFESPVPLTGSKRGERSDSLEELLRAEILEASAADELEKEKNRKVQFFEELQSVVKKLQHEDSRKEAASEVRRLSKDNAEARETMAMLGAIPPLAGAIDSGDLELQIESLYALLNLGIGNDVNKAAIVKVGAVHKMLTLMESGCNQSLSEAIVANFLGLSALDSNKPIIGASGAITFLVSTFRNAEPKTQSRLDSLRSLFNLSISPSNAPHLVEAELVPCLFEVVGDMEVTEKVLSVLSNLVGSPEGRRAVSRSQEAIPILIDVLNWCDSPECQEKAAYTLMIMAYKAYSDRSAMIEAGIVTSLLELTLIGSALAQKRASRILEILRVDKGKQISEGFVGSASRAGSGTPPISAPLFSCGPSDDGKDEQDSGLSEERKAVKELVQQSLHNNMRRIVKRANLPHDFAPSEIFRSAVTKNLPF